MIDSKVSVIIRTKNEERWIEQCLRAVSMQDWRDFEVILVDNESTDSTIRKAASFRPRLVKIGDDEFSFGRAINKGVRASNGGLIALLSGHCIPLNEKWLERLALNFTHPEVAGVYGRQEPLPETSDYDKRDLWTTFGTERRLQRTDFMFHNANCMIRRSVWDAIPFDEEISGVEDRDWARKVVERGFHIVYEPLASVHHFHGIHHGRDETRARRVARVIEFIQKGGTQ